MDGTAQDTTTPLDDTTTVGLSIFEIATARWLHVEEIISLLSPETTPLSLSTSPPTSPPPSGTLLLYDRSVTRKYKADGHEWIKKRNSPKVREDHVKLRFQGAYRVAGSYVHSARTATLHRRAYRLLDVPGTTPGLTQNWVLLHYLDTMEAAQVSALFADHLAAAASKTGLAPHNRRFSGGGGSHTPSPAPTPPNGGLVFRPAAQLGMQQPAAPQAQVAQAQAQLSVHQREQQRAAAAQALGGPAWPEYAKHVAAATVKMGGADSQLPRQQKLADPALALKLGLKPAQPTVPTPHDAIVAAAGHDLQQQQQLVAEKMSARPDGAVKGGELPGHQRDASLDDGTMDVLWNMVMEEGTEDVDNELKEAAASAIQQHMTPIIEAELVNTVEDAIQDVATSALEEHVNFVSDDDILQAVEQVMTEGSLESGTIEEKVVSTLEDKLPAQLEAKLLETMEKELAPSTAQEGGAMSDGPEEVQHEDDENMGSKSPPPSSVPQTPLPEIIDFTPNESLMHSDRPMSLVISTSAAIPILPPDDLPYRWHLLAAFVDMSSSAIFAEPSKATSPVVAVTAETDPTIMKVALTPLRKLTPFSYKCEAPLDISFAGSRSLIIVGVRYVESPEPVWDAIRLAVKVCIQAEWQVASDLNEAQASVGAALVRPTFYAPAGGGNVQLLSQLSQDLFTFYDHGNFPSRVMVTNHPLSKQSANDSNINDDYDAQGRSSSKSVSSMRSGTNTEEGGAGQGLPAPAPTMVTLASAMTSLPFNPPERAIDVAPSLSRKRTLSVDDETAIADLASANEAAADWIGKQDPNADHEKTLGETVDRHCKIRFVERLANAAAAADPELKPHKQRHEPVNTDDEQSDDSDYGSIKLDASKLQQIDEDMLDSLLDSVLIKFVESLVDTCASDEEMKKEINTMGYAGFALLHYAALYNMKSLIPLLLKKGADPDLQTLKGGLTPLHLAAGAGHDQICDLLARSGATVNVQDSFGLIPADHATRNGFKEIGSWLQDKKLPALEPKVVDAKPSSENERHLSKHSITNAAFESWAQNDPADDFLQSAFKGLPLKDKLGLNLFVQKYRRKAKSRREADSRKSDRDDDDDEDDSMSDSSDEEEGGERMAMARSSRDTEGDSQVNSSTSASGSDGGDHMSDLRFISEKDRESLKVAMSMMSKEERKELERSAPYSDVRNWMLRSNYESLREASIQLEKQAKRKTLTKVMNSETTVGQIQTGSANGQTGQQGNPKLSQALAMLALRKNLLAAKGKQPSQGAEQQS